MKEVYRLPIMGQVKSEQPLQGVDAEPVMPIPIVELPGFKALMNNSFGYTVLQYDINGGCCDVEIEAGGEFHQWLSNLMPTIKVIAENKAWKLEKTRLEVM